MNLKNFKKDRLQHMEHFQFAGRVLQLCREVNVEKLTAVLDPLKTAVDKEDEALNQPNAQFGTEELERLDMARDNAYYAFRLMVEMHLRSDDETIVGAAKRVDEVMSRYPRAAAENYDKETGMIKNLIADLKTDDLKPAMQKIGGTAALTRLDMANAAFDSSFHARIRQLTPQGTFDVKALRQATDKALETVLRRIDSLDDLEPSAEITALIGHYNNLVANRKTLLAVRSAANQAAREKKDLERLLPEFEKAQGFAPHSLTLTGKTAKGADHAKLYELVSLSGESVWVKVEKDKLVKVAAPVQE